MEIKLETKLYCRTCLKNDTKIIYSIFENNIINLIMECTSVQIDEKNSEISTMICEFCYQFILNYKFFKEQVIKNEEYLKNKYLCPESDEKKYSDSNWDYNFNENKINIEIETNKATDDNQNGNFNSLDNLNENRKKRRKYRIKCKICNKTFSDLSGLRIHNLSLKHKKSLLKLKQDNTEIIHEDNFEEIEENKNVYFKKTNNVYLCEFCQDSFEKLKDIHDHYFKTHHSKLKEKYFKNLKISSKYYCFICKIYCKKPIFPRHLKCYKHKIKSGLINDKQKKIIKDNKEIDIKNDEFGHYLCEICCLVFNKFRKFEYHIDSPLHKEFVNKSKELNLSIEDINKSIKLIENNEYKSVTKSIFCNVCNISFSSSNDLVEHIDLNHKTEQNTQAVFYCKYCKITILNDFKNHIILKTHQNAILAFNKIVRKALSHLILNIPKECKICKRTFVNRKKYQNHLYKQPHKLMATNLKSNEDGDEIESKDFSKENQYHCNDCNYTYFSKKQFDHHVSSHDSKITIDIKSNDLGLKCNYCERTFKYRYNYYKHVNYHNGINYSKEKMATLHFKNNQKKVICDVCGLKVSNFSNHLKNIHKIFKPNEKFKCQICKNEQLFDTNDLLIEHLKSVHNTTVNKDRVFCPICSTKLYSENVSRHMKIVHYKITPFECQMCTKRFKRPYDLKIHLRIHNDERPFSCNICSQAFRAKTVLKKHMVIHTGERFPCEICGKSFTQKTCVNQHKKREHLNLLNLINKNNNFVK